MKAYAVQNGDIPMAALQALEAAREVWVKLPDRRFTAHDGLRDWTCHGLCGAVYELLGNDWRWYTGYFWQSYEHSWLSLEKYDSEETILDVYPVGSASGPLLLCAHTMTPWSRPEMYRLGREPYVQMIRQQCDKEVREILRILHEPV